MRARDLIAIWFLLATATVAQSRRWFATEVNCWITQKKVPASWDDAQQRCEKHGAVLASPLNTKIFDYMQSLINVNNHSAAYFIGYRANRSDDGQEVHYVSVEGKRLDEMPRDVFEAIELLDLEQGDCLSMNRHGIRAVSCWDHLPYICYSNETAECGSAPAPTSSTSAPLSSSSASPQVIRPDYTYYSATGSSYKLYKTLVSWNEANTRCMDEGTHLVVINDATEASIVADILKGASYHDMWIGLLDKGTGGVRDWRTIHGTPIAKLFHEFGINRPTHNPDWMCAALNMDKRLYDVYCHYKAYFMCES